MINWLCDTNVVSELMRRDPDEHVFKWAAVQEHFRLSVITVEEINCGLQHRNLPKKRAWFARFLEQCCEIMPVDDAIAAKAGQMRGAFLKQGITRTQADMLIGATAWRHQLTIVSRNTTDFDRCGVPVLNPFSAL